jgi:hypothetical protein
VVVPVIALLVQDNANDGAQGIVLAGRMNADMHDTFCMMEAADLESQNPALTPAQTNCLNNCRTQARMAETTAIAAFVAALAGATALLANTLVNCAVSAGFPPLGTLFSSACALSALTIYAVAVALGSLALAAALVNIATQLLNCIS